jgi:MFS family permease
MLLFWINLTNSLDHGALPSAINDIKKSVVLSDGQTGMLLAMVFFGLFFGSLVASPIISKYKMKHILVLSYLLNAVG